MRITPAVPRAATRLPERGMSLIEILVGIVIGMLGILVIFSVLAVAEGRKRTTTAGTDAQMAGAVALFSLERDVKQAGYGFGTPIPAAMKPGHDRCEA